MKKSEENECEKPKMNSPETIKASKIDWKSLHISSSSFTGPQLDDGQTKALKNEANDEENAVSRRDIAVPAERMIKALRPQRRSRISINSPVGP